MVPARRGDDSRGGAAAAVWDHASCSRQECFAESSRGWSEATDGDSPREHGTHHAMGSRILVSDGSSTRLLRE